MGIEILLCFEKGLELFLFSDSFLIISGWWFDPLFDFLGIAMANLKDLKLDILDTIFQDKSFDIFGYEFSQILDNNFIIGNDSFFEYGHYRIFDDNRILFIFLWYLFLVGVEIFVVCVEVVHLAFYYLLDEDGAFSAGLVYQLVYFLF